MSISDLDRIKLFNQYSILHEIQPNQGWGELAEILQNGYEGEYYRIKETVYHPLREEDCREVNNILEMFDVLQRPHVDEDREVPNNIRFDGFDGNNEGDLLRYFRFMRERDGRWTHIVMAHENSLNSHLPVLDTYRRMLSAWQQMGSLHQLTQEQFDQIVAERVHPENRS